MEELSKLRSKDVTTKSLVFSQFVSFLDIIAFRLQRAGFKVCRLEGGMTVEGESRSISSDSVSTPSLMRFLHPGRRFSARQATIERFTNSADVTIFLISLVSPVARPSRFFESWRLTRLFLLPSALTESRRSRPQSHRGKPSLSHG